MPKRIHKQLFVLCTLFLFPVFSHAQVVINEISYSSQSKSWIEIYNGSASAIDLTQYKVLDSGASTNGHAISVISGTNPLPPQGYAIIAKDPTIFPSASFPLFKSALGANTSGDTLTLKNGSTVVDSVSFANTQGANGDGNSLQKQADGTWIAAVPTPGALNSNTPVTSVTGSGSSGTSASSTDTGTTSNMASVASVPVSGISTHYSYLPLSDFEAQEALAVSAGRDRLSVVGSPLEFQAEANTFDDTVVYTWNFGDGSVGGGKLVQHAYEYPGTYVVVLNASLPDAHAISRTTVTVVNPNLEITEANSQYIKIKNGGDKEINLYGWEIISEGKSFVFPMDTIILAGESICFSNTVTSLVPLGNLDVQIFPVTEAPLTVAVSKTSSTFDVAIMYQKLVSLKQQADELATTNISTQSQQEATTQTSNTESSEVATPIEAPVSGGWVTTLKHFFFGTQ